MKYFIKLLFSKREFEQDILECKFIWILYLIYEIMHTYTNTVL